jgi:hypothetical protein
MLKANRQLPPAPLLPAVLLQHTLPDGSWHFDLMIAQHESPDLWTLRVSQAFDLKQHAPFEGTSLPPHRSAYLTYEGPVRDGKLGSVRRVLQGLGAVVVRESISITLQWDGSQPMSFEAHPTGDSNCDCLQFFPLPMHLEP